MSVTRQRNVETLITLQPIAVETDSPDREGRLVIANGKLIAVLVRLESPEHEHAGSWFLEAGFGALRGVRPPPFATLDEATKYLRRHVKPMGRDYSPAD